MPDATYDILVSIRDKLDGLDKTLSGLKGVGQGVDDVNAKATLLGKTFKAVFGANIAERAMMGLVNTAKQAATAAFTLASEIRDGAANLDLSMRGYQVYRQLIRDTGGDMGSFTMSLTTFNRALRDSADSSSAAAAAFEAAGLDPISLQATDLEHAWAEAATAVEAMDDKQTALAVKATLFGERTIPRLRGAIQDLAEKGYDELAASMERANMILADSEIARLDAGAKLVERTMLQATRVSGALEADLLGIGMGAGTLPIPRAPADEGRLRNLATQRQALERLREAFENAAKAEEIFEGHPGKTDQERRDQRIRYLQAQINLLRELKQLRKDMPVDVTLGETQDKRRKEQQDLIIQIQKLENERNALQGVQPPTLANLKRRALGVNERTINPNALTVGQGVQAGALDWIESLGSSGEQVAGVISQSLGGAISAVSAKLGGQDVRSWGEVWKNTLQSLLVMLIQVQLQMIALKALMGIFGGLGGAGGGGAGAGGPASGLVGDGLSDVWSTPVDFMSNLPGRATGGDVQVGRMYRINEGDEPVETFIPLVPGRISSSGPLVAGGGGRSIVVHQTLQVSTGVQETVRAEMVQMMPMMRQLSVDGVREAIARNQIELG